MNTTKNTKITKGNLEKIADPYRLKFDVPSWCAWCPWWFHPI
jgi:hypothetical protein